MKKVLFIVGSLRANSFNRQLAELAARRQDEGSRSRHDKEFCCTFHCIV